MQQLSVWHVMKCTHSGTILEHALLLFNYFEITETYQKNVLVKKCVFHFSLQHSMMMRKTRSKDGGQNMTL